jgi:hypothetical protein
MGLKEQFLTYVEQQRNANAHREAYGPDDRRTIEAYANANNLKRKMLETIEEVEKK